MRVAIYNQMFGLNGNSLWKSLIGHWAVHFQANPKKVWKRTKILGTLNTISQANPDVIGVVEVLEGQEKELKQNLRKLGYNFFYISRGHKTKYSRLYVQVFIASRIKGKQIIAGKWPTEDNLGGGGGFAHVQYDKPRFHLVLAHFSFPHKKCYKAQLSFLKNYLKKLKGKIVLMGDFNLSYGNLNPHFQNLRLVSEKTKTCSTTPVLRWFYNEDVDHILVRGFKPEACGAIKGNSDHLLLYADLVGNT